MFFNKYPHRANFSFTDAIGPRLGTRTARFGEKTAELSVRAFAGRTFEIALKNPDIWSPNLSPVPLTLPPVDETTNLPFQPQVGLMGDKSLWAITLPEGTRFYGMGEKNLAEAVRAVARLPRASILVLAGSLMGGDISAAIDQLRQETGIPVVSLNMAGSVPDHADLVVSDPVQAGVMAVMAIADTAKFDIARLKNRRF